MPCKNGSCLNDQCTEAVKKIHELLKEAKETYNSLPDCIKHVETEHQRLNGNTLGWYLDNGETCAYCFAKEFGIEVSR